MKTVKELVAEINEANSLSVYDVYVEGAEEIATVDRDEHRWYVVATVVFKAADGFLGVRGPVSLKSEGMGYDDIGMPCKAFEMEEVPTVTYKQKK